MNRFLTLLVATLCAISAWAEAPLSGEYVDLGLSVKWATCNLGATSSTDAGWYLAWGETDEKSDYSWETYLSALGGTMTQDQDAGTDKDPLKEYVYGGSHSEGISGTAYDAATAALGAGYRMPKREEFEELTNTENCTWEWYAKGNTEFNGVAGYKVTSKKDGFTDKFIFLPVTGFRNEEGLNYKDSHGFYWSSEANANGASFMYYTAISSAEIATYYSNYRYFGQSIRPVYVGLDTTPTAIDGINADNAQKVVKTIENGKVVIIRNGERYDITGRKL